MLHILEHALIDSLYMLPVLVAVYFLLEVLEFRGVTQLEKSKMLSGKASPVFGALFGCVPQCGFSVVSTDLFSKKKLSIGALIAVFVATSDEAIPLMLADITAIPYLLLLIALKIVFAILVGYLAIFLHSRLFKKSYSIDMADEEQIEKQVGNTREEQIETLVDNASEEALEAWEPHMSEEHTENEEEHHSAFGCCHHDIAQEKFDWKHPLLHSLKIFAFILVINIVFGAVIHFVGGEDALVEFLDNSSAFQPLLAVIVGLIPNCASSVVLTQLYLLGGLSFGALFTGLSVNAGLGLVVLFKENKNVKENLFVLAVLIIPSVLVGYGLHFLF